MIEADVITGHLADESASGGEKTDRIPIMGHPPAITSDLSLKEFLDAWNQTEKILKLDFKSTEAFVLATPIMENAFKVSIQYLNIRSIFNTYRHSTLYKHSIKRVYKDGD